MQPDMHIWPNTSRSFSKYDIPPDTEATELIQEYFATVGLFLPCIHEDSFILAYKEARQRGFKNVRRSWLALLYMVFAVVHHTRTATSPVNAAAKESETYYRRALAVAMPEAVTDASLEIGKKSPFRSRSPQTHLLWIVQLLCLINSYLQGSPHSSQAWTFHALAVKAAMQLGLHSAEASTQLPLLECEMRRRTWYWCVINDAWVKAYTTKHLPSLTVIYSILSVKFGRPPFVSRSLTAVELPKDINSVFPASNRSAAAIATSVAYYRALMYVCHLQKRGSANADQWIERFRTSCPISLPSFTITI